jgi:hypothetical protein
MGEMVVFLKQGKVPKDLGTAFNEALGYRLQRGPKDSRKCYQNL